MVLYTFRRKFYRWLRENYHFYHVLFRSPTVPVRSKKVFMELETLALNRYLYNFIKFFLLSGYTVYLPKNKKVVSSLARKKGEFIYSSWILTEGVKLGQPKQPHLRLSKEVLSNDYFSNFKDSTRYQVPMSEFPAMYRFNVPLPRRKNAKDRKNSVFMTGNISDALYRNISQQGLFSLPSRGEMAGFLHKQPYYLDIKTRVDLNRFLTSGEDKKVILIDTSKDFRIPYVELKTVLGHFNFFLALPGIWIPQSHNVIEAMSVGCIPVLHKEYAESFKPSLQHFINAIIFESFESLDENIKAIFNFQENEIENMQENVTHYYSNYLIPGAVVREIEEGSFTTISIQAEEKSVGLYRLRNE